MSYRLSSMTLRTNNTSRGLAAIAALWADVQSEKLPLLFDSGGAFHAGLSPISRYSGYSSYENGEYDLSIFAVSADFFAALEQKAAQGTYRKYEVSGEDLSVCTRAAWEQVWADQKAGRLQRTFSEDFERTVPTEYTKDGMCHCYLYIAI